MRMHDVGGDFADLSNERHGPQHCPTRQRAGHVQTTGLLEPPCIPAEEAQRQHVAVETCGIDPPHQICHEPL